MIVTADRYHDFSCGHRVHGHESKCRFLHGHNYRVTFVCEGDDGLDRLGRVLDFGAIKARLCEWLEREWDHRFLVWANDPLEPFLRSCDPEGVVAVDFNPTAENMAIFLLTVVGPRQLAGTGVVLTSVRVEETRKCAAEASL